MTNGTIRRPSRRGSPILPGLLLGLALAGGTVLPAAAQSAAAPAAAPAAPGATVPAAAAPARETPFPGTSIVLDVATGAVLSQDDASHRWYPASTTKLMTTYVALAMVKAGEAGLDTPVVMSRDAADEPPSKMGYEPGSVLRLDNALRIIMVKSANDVASAIAESLGGRGRDGEQRFVERMNATALRLGMTDSRFINAHGLPGEGQYSSAKDLAILALALKRDFPLAADLFSTEAIFTGTDTIRNHNDLLGRFAGADGMKTGYICASGFNIVSTATRGERTLVAVVLGAPSVIQRARRAAELLDAGFAAPVPAAAPRVADLPASSGPPADVSGTICSDAGRTMRANEAKAAEKHPENPYGTPLLAEMGRPPQIYPVKLGGAAGAPGIDPGISLIAAYGIPIPTWRPTEPPFAPSDPAAPAAAAAMPAAGTSDTAAASLAQDGEGDAAAAAGLRP